MATQPEIRRVILALEPPGIQQASLELALQLARSYGAELAGLLIEDMNLLRAAALPFTSEILWRDAGERRLDTDQLDRSLRAAAERLKEILARRAQTSGVRWSFHNLQARTMRDTLASITPDELMIMGRLSRMPWTGNPMLERIVLLYAEVEAYHRFESLAHRVVESLQGTGWTVPRKAVWEGLQISRPGLVAATLHTLKPALVVTPSVIWLDQEHLLRELLDRCECPLIFIGEQPGPVPN